MTAQGTDEPGGPGHDWSSCCTLFRCHTVAAVQVSTAAKETLTGASGERSEREDAAAGLWRDAAGLLSHGPKGTSGLRR